jgi:hypothetical protein
LSTEASAVYATVAMECGSPRLRFAILAESNEIPEWTAVSIERLLQSGRAEATTVISAELGALGRGRMSLLPRLYRERWVERRSRALQPVGIASRWPDLPVIQLGASGLAREAALAAIGEQGLDFILACGAALPADELLALSRLGVWVHALGRGGAPCFRELVDGDTTTRVALESWTPRGRRLLCEGRFSTCKASWVNNIDRACFGAADFAARACALVSSGDEDGRAAATPGAPDLARPRNRDMARLFWRGARRVAEKLWELGLHVEIWNVGSSTQSLEQVVRSSKVDPDGVSWCKPHAPGHFIADPFVYVEAGEPRLIVEDYDQVRGRICTVLPSNGSSRVELDVDLDLPFHMSYPCIFEEGGQTYCIPEVYQSKSASLYRRNAGRWELVRPLIEGAPIVDPTLFKRDGRYWLLFTLQDDGAWGNQKLYAYHAHALDAPWTAHPHNPVKCDIGSTRPAGNVFELDGELYRPSQDCSATYGGAVVINHIAKLTPTEFEERSVARIEPIAGSPYRAGFHTLNATATGVVFDGKKFAFDWLAWRKNRGRFHEVFL